MRLTRRTCYKPCFHSTQPSPKPDWLRSNCLQRRSTENEPRTFPGVCPALHWPIYTKTYSLTDGCFHLYPGRPQYGDHNTQRTGYGAMFHAFKAGRRRLALRPFFLLLVQSSFTRLLSFRLQDTQRRIGGGGMEELKREMQTEDRIHARLALVYGTGATEYCRYSGAPGAS